MTVLFHPEFPNDIRKFEAGYGQISVGLGKRFRDGVNSAVSAVKAAPTSAGHFRHLSAFGFAARALLIHVPYGEPISIQGHEGHSVLSPVRSRCRRHRLW